MVVICGILEREGKITVLQENEKQQNHNYCGYHEAFAGFLKLEFRKVIPHHDKVHRQAYQQKIGIPYRFEYV
jgi:hypothetical protein